MFISKRRERIGEGRRREWTHFVSTIGMTLSWSSFGIRWRSIGNTREVGLRGEMKSQEDFMRELYLKKVISNGGTELFKRKLEESSLVDLPSLPSYPHHLLVHPRHCPPRDLGIRKD
jgi:hypothetical protein